MRRLIIFISILLVTTSPYLLMIYSPEKFGPFVDNIASFLTNDRNNKPVLVILLFSLLSFYYWEIAVKVEHPKTSAICFTEKAINHTRILIVTLAMCSVTYILCFEMASFKAVISTVSVILIAFYFYLIKYGIKDA